MSEQEAPVRADVGDEALKKTVLIRISGGMFEALCAEPAVAAHVQATGRQVTVCSLAADLYVGHPQIAGIMYSAADAAGGRFERVVELAADADDPVEMTEAFARQLSVTVERYRPAVHVTSMDRLRVGRLGLKRHGDRGVVIVLCGTHKDTRNLEILAADIEERLGTNAIFISGQKYPGLEHGLNLTGKLMPREMITILERADGWVGFDAQAAVMGWTVGKRGVVFSESGFESPDETIRVCGLAGGRETLLEKVSQLFDSDSEAISE